MSYYLEVSGRYWIRVYYPVAYMYFYIGDLGAGKTTFGRGFIRKKCEDPQLLVTSPSYLLDNCYEFGNSEKIHHMDLYRLPQNCNLSFLSIPEIFSNTICLIEWPERLGNYMPKEYIDCELNIREDECRIARFQLIGDKWKSRTNVIRQSIEESL